ncbi:uncharacterized protein LOC144592278 [Rhinoraja longicauda]
MSGRRRHLREGPSPRVCLVSPSPFLFESPPISLGAAAIFVRGSAAAIFVRGSAAAIFVRGSAAAIFVYKRVRYYNCACGKAMRICAILGCGSSTYHLSKWMHTVCDSHNCKFATGNCFCPPPFKLHPFPTEKRDGAARLRWTKLVNRKDGKGKNWQPDLKGNSRVCSKHFVDGEPTTINPDPVLNLGYLLSNSPGSPRSLPGRDGKPSNQRRKSVTAKQTNVDRHLDNGPDYKRLRAFAVDHAYVYKCSCQENCNCKGCIQKQKDINKLTDKVEMLEGKVEELKQKLKNAAAKKRFCSNIKTDKNVSRLTGLSSKVGSDNLCEYMKHRAKKIRYWEGRRKVVSTKVLHRPSVARASSCTMQRKQEQRARLFDPSFSTPCPLKNASKLLLSIAENHPVSYCRHLSRSHHLPQIPATEW